jgi:hypothetical protein
VQQAASRATENLVYTATADLVSKDRKGFFQGYSNIAGLGNQRLASILAKGGETEEIVSATLDFRLLHYWSKKLNWREAYPKRLINEEFKSLEKKEPK